MAAYINLGLIIVSILADAGVAGLTILHGKQIEANNDAIVKNDTRITNQENVLQKDDMSLLKNYKKDMENIKKKTYKPILSKRDVIRANKIINSKIKDPKTKMLVKKDIDKYKRDFTSHLKKTKKTKTYTKKQTKKNK